MRILAIDTASDTLALACGVSGSQPALIARDGDREHSTRLLALIDEVAAGSRDFGRICVVSGPGAYSGLRVGIATARGLALASGVSLVAVSTHMAIAAVANLDGSWLAIHPAGRGEFAVRECTGDLCTGPLEALPGDRLHGKRVAGEGAGALGGLEVDAIQRVAAAFRLAPHAPDLEDAVYLRAPSITKPRGSALGLPQQEIRQ